MSPRLSLTTIGAAVCVGVAAWLSIGDLAVSDAAGASRIGLLPPAWSLPLSVGAVLAVLAALRVSSRASLPLFLSLLIWLPWLPVPVPDIFLAITGPAVAFVWASIGLALVASRPPRTWLAASVLRGTRSAPAIAGAAAFVVFLAVWAGQQPPPSGDEPHYLVAAQSLLTDRDLKVENNYARRDYLPYYRGELQPHLAQPGLDGSRITVHGPGLAAFIAPAFALGGYRAVVVWLAALVAFGTALVWKAGYLLTGDYAAAWFGWAVATLTVPAILLASLVFPDAVAGAVLAAGVLALISCERSSDRLPAWQSAVLGIAVGLLPWLHTRLALPAVVLAALLVTRRRRIGALAFGLPFAASLAGWFGFFFVTYGTINPVAQVERTLIDPRLLATGLPGLLIDQSFGLLSNAPVHVVSMIGLALVFRQRVRLGLEWLAILVPYALAVAAFQIWWAAVSTPARLIAPIIFPLSVGAAAAWAGLSGRSRSVSLALLAASVLIGSALAWGGHGVLAYNPMTGRARWLDWVSPLIDLPSALPSIINSDTIVPLAAWAIAACAGLFVFAWLDRRLGSTRPVRATLLVACAAGVAATAITAAWKLEASEPIEATRAQLDLLRSGTRGLLPLGVQPYPPRVFRRAEALSHIAIATSRTDHPPSGTLLALDEVPAGRYRVRVTPGGTGDGQLVLGIGRASVPAARWSVTGGSAGSYRLDLPAAASRIVVTGAGPAVSAAGPVVLVPALDGAPMPPIEGRIRDAARYGSTTVYAIDDRVWLEAEGLWVMGERQPTVILAADDPARPLTIELANISMSNRIRLRTREWSAERILAPNERWLVPLPAGPAGVVALTIDVEHGLQPARVNPSSRDHRFLGCSVVVH